MEKPEYADSGVAEVSGCRSYDELDMTWMDIYLDELPNPSVAGHIKTLNALRVGQNKILYNFFLYT